MNTNEAKGWLMGAVVIVALVILFVLSLSGCSSFDKDVAFDSGCDMECKGCQEVKLKCNQRAAGNEDTVTQGTISGPKIE